MLSQISTGAGTVDLNMFTTPSIVLILFFAFCNTVVAFLAASGADTAAEEALDELAAAAFWNSTSSGDGASLMSSRRSELNNRARDGTSSSSGGSSEAAPDAEVPALLRLSLPSLSTAIGAAELLLDAAPSFRCFFSLDSSSSKEKNATCAA